MNVVGWIVLLIVFGTPAWAADRSKSTAQSLREMLSSAHATRASDADVAAELSRVELTEELTVGALTELSPLLAGPLSTEQLSILEARSAVLLPPVGDLPATDVPSRATQLAMLAKAENYAVRIYAGLPELTAKRLAVRFQDGFGDGKGRGDTRVLYTHSDLMQWVAGVEKASIFTETMTEGRNHVFAVVDVSLTPDRILRELGSVENLRFLRWELVEGRQVAVFAFRVDTKRTRYGVTYRYVDSESRPVGSPTFLPGSGTTDTGGSISSSETVKSWKSFAHRVGYRGEIFVVPETGVIVRTVTEAEFKPNDILRSETVRTDYAPVRLAGGTLVLPIRSFKVTEFVKTDGQFADKGAVRRTYLTEDYENYRMP